MKKNVLWLLVFSLLFSFSACREEARKSADSLSSLSQKDRATLTSILDYWETWVPDKKKEGKAPLISFKQLYHGLSAEQQEFLDRIRAIKPSDKDFDPLLSFEKIEGQQILRDGKPLILDIQYLPEPVYQAYEKMMAAMKEDLGKRLWVESGYRSPAYQLYTFLYYTPKHHYSIEETNEWVALPGHSEHGDPENQAIDFVNEEGINGDSDFGQTAEDFEKLPEYEWLQKNAEKFGFVLSYPRGHQSTTFEPWHWRYGGAESGGTGT